VSKPPARVVAIVEDDESMRSAMRRVLETEGYVTEIFGSAEEFIAKGAATRARCLVLDLRLPGMSGLELYRHLRSWAQPMPTVLVTAYDLRVSAGDLASGDACLQKPFPAELLLGAVERCLSGRA
jgi:FixJ family two-component response regulator